MARGGDFTVVIDAGHGGKDHGAVGSRAKEKDVNLGVALRLGDMIEREMKDVNVVYTRSKDYFVTLQGRADIANNAGGDLFISIHTNSVDAKSKSRTTVNGASVYTLGLKKGEENLNVAKRENSVIMLEPDYTTTYRGFDPSSTESYIMFELSRDIHMDHSIKVANEIQKELVATAGRRDKSVRQAPFWVLVQTSMPSILIELDFICNPTVEKFLASKDGQKKLAKAIFNGFKKYKHSCDLEKKALQGKSPESPAGRGKARARDLAGASPVRTSDSGQKDKSPKESGEKSSSTKKDDSRRKSSSSLVYKIQFLAYNTQLKSGSSKFKGLSPVDFYKEKKTYKYTYGAYSSRKEAEKALPAVRRKFSDAFIIPTLNGRRISLDEEKSLLKKLTLKK